MGDTAALNVQPRDESMSAKALRSEGMVPGVVYGKKQEPVHFSIPINVIEKFHHTVGFSTVIDLAVEGGKKPIKSLLHDVQYDSAHNRIQHVDFYAVVLGEKMTANVSLDYMNGDEIEMVRSGEAVLTTLLDDVEVNADPMDLPDMIHVDLSALKEINDHITVADLTAGSDKAEITTDAELIVAKLDAPAEEEVDEVVETAEDGEEADAGSTDSDESADDSSDENAEEKQD